MWRIAQASVTGTSHLKLRNPCQDTSESVVMSLDDGSILLVAVVSDGAGSASEGATGAQLACSSLIATVRELADSSQLNSQFAEDVVTRWIAAFHNVIQERAESANLSARDFACTSLVALVSDGAAIFLQVGDGAIVVRDRHAEGYDWVFWPQTGEYANTTNFATDPNVRDHLEWALVTHHVDEVALFTDGLQMLILHFATRTAYSPFFEKMFRPLRSVDAYDSNQASRALAVYLDSPAVNARTDDDKTLLLASRIEDDSSR